MLILLLQSWGSDFPYEQPVQMIKVDGQHFALPPDFVQGLNFLCPFTVSKHHWMQWVHLFGGRLYSAPDSLIVEFPERWFRKTTHCSGRTGRIALV